MNKIDEKTKRLYGWMKGKSKPPYTIELIPTNRCNFNCKSCWRQGASNEEMEKIYKEELSDERLLKLIDEAHEIDVKEIAFVGGGEPLARSITLELIKRTRKFNMTGDLVTNGSLLTEDIIKTLVKIQWTRIKFSIDGANPDLQDSLRRTKCFDKIIKNIQSLSAMKKQKKSDFPRIGFNVVISNQNYVDLPNIIELAHAIGGNEIMILPITVFSDEGKKLILDKKQIAEFQTIIKKSLPKIKEYGISSNMNKFFDERFITKTNSMHEVIMEEAEKDFKILENDIEDFEKYNKKYPINFMMVPCFEPWSHVTILANGNIACCFNKYVWETKVTIKDHTLEELWYGDYFKKYRDEIMSGKLPDACATCCVWRVFEIKSIRNKLKEYSNHSIGTGRKARL